MDVAHVTTEGQMMILARLHRKCGIQPGTEVHFIEGEQEIIFQLLTRYYIRSVRGMLKGHGFATQELPKERSRDRKHEDAKGAKLDVR